MLKEVRLSGVGPVADLHACFAKRLNVLTGDNGLGKSFLLDTAWWALTGTWAGGREALPNRNGKDKTTITYHISGKKGAPAEPKTAHFDFSTQSWVRPRGRPTMPGLVIYGRVDGSFSVWDPARNYGRNPGTGEVEALERPRAYAFTPVTLWDGLREAGRTLCNGLIHDWVSWQTQAPNAVEQAPFPLLEQTLKQLSHPEEPMEPGKPIRLYLDDTRLFPTLRTPYDDAVPLTYAAAGVRRIVGLAYLLVWSWDEHRQAARLRNEEPTDRLVLLLDEVESHLHPKWQRTILPALLGFGQLNDQMHVQALCSTHSPLVLASLEPFFDEDKDKLFWFDLQGSKVFFREYPWAKQGDVVNWLTSDIFGLKQARSKEAEQVIEAAENYMDDRTDDLPGHLRTRKAIQKELLRVLPGDDPFLVRWQLKMGAVPQS